MSDSERAVVTPEGRAGLTFYYAVLCGQDGEEVTNCSHRHKTHDAAETCARTWLLREYKAASR